MLSKRKYCHLCLLSEIHLVKLAYVSLLCLLDNQVLGSVHFVPDKASPDLYT